VIFDDTAIADPEFFEKYTNWVKDGSVKLIKPEFDPLTYWGEYYWEDPEKFKLTKI
jgi:hypothetical protein